MTVVRVRYTTESGLWWAESDDLRGWSAAGSSLEEVRDQVRSGIVEFIGPDSMVVEDVPAPSGVWQGFFAIQSNFSGADLHLYANVVPLIEGPATVEEGGTLHIKLQEAN